MSRKAEIGVRVQGSSLILGNSHLVITCDLEKGTWDLVSLGAVSLSARALSSRILVDGEWTGTGCNPVQRWEHGAFADGLGEGERIKLSYELSGGGLALSLVMCLYESRPSLLLSVHLQNRTERAKRVEDIRPLEMDLAREGALDLGMHLDSAKIYCESNNACASFVRDLKGPGAEDHGSVNPPASGERVGESREALHRSGWLGLIFNPESKTSFLAGFVSVETALGKVVTRYRPGVGIARWYAACMYDGLEIGPGEELASEMLYVDVRPDPFESLEKFADAVVAENKLGPITETPALWCSWYPYRLKLTEDEVLKNARVVAERFRDSYGVKAMQLDYGWNHKDIPGDWWNNQERFPHGVPWLIDQLRSMGLELGIYLSPFIAFEGSQLFQEHPASVIKDHEGNPSKWTTPWPWEPKQNIYDLDLGCPETREFLQRVFRELASLGINYFKLDFLSGPSSAPLSFSSGIRDEDRVRDGERVRIGLSLIRRIIGDDAYLLACNLPHSHSLGIASATFTAIDVGNAYFGRDERWDHFRTRSSGLITRYYQQKRFWHNDPDVIYVGGNPPGFDEVSDLGEARMRITIVALSGGPVLLGDNLPMLPEDRLDMCTLCLPAYGVSARPVDLFTRDSPRVWDLKVEAAWGKWDVVGLLNYENEDAPIPVEFSDLRLDSRREYLVWEFWEQRFLGIHRGGVQPLVPARNVGVLLIKEVPTEPTVLSTSLHLSQGAVELPEVTWDTRMNVLSGVCRRAAGARGEIFLYVPGEFEVIEGRTGSGNEWEPAEIGAPAANVVSLKLEFPGPELRWEARFRQRGSL
ncbi:MAG: alpha-galactosidase [Firmicutes bacterium]|nr:alpha-galactosidase [Bacillota bacterium]